jgi:hypothetical protein
MLYQFVPFALPALDAGTQGANHPTDIFCIGDDLRVELT